MICITEEGKKIFEKTEIATNITEQRIVSILTEDEIENFLNIICKLKTGIEETL